MLDGRSTVSAVPKVCNVLAQFSKIQMAAILEVKKAAPSTRTRTNMTLRIPVDVRSIKGGFLKL